jgi:hypothetical protein
MMEIFKFTELGTDQKKDNSHAIERENYTTISLAFTPPLTHKQISKALFRTALGFSWTRGMKGGPKRYLSPVEEEKLKEIIAVSSENFLPIDWHQMIDEILNLKQERIEEGADFLRKANCKQLLENFLSIQIIQPSRSWLNYFAERESLHLKNRRVIEENHISSDSVEEIRSFFMNFCPLINSVHPVLTYGADETMLKTISKGKVIVP